MGIQDSFSKLKKKVKHLGRKRKPDRTGGGGHGESVDPGNPLPRPDPQIEAGNDEWDGAAEGGQQASSTDQPPQPDEPELVSANESENEQGGREAETGQAQQPDEPEPVPTSRSENDQGGRKAGVDGGEVKQWCSHPNPGVEFAVGSGSSRGEGEKVETVYPHSSTPPTPRSRKPDGM